MLPFMRLADDALRSNPEHSSTVESSGWSQACFSLHHSSFIKCLLVCAVLRGGHARGVSEENGPCQSCHTRQRQGLLQLHVLGTAYVLPCGHALVLSL